MKTLYGTFSEEQMEQYKKKLHSKMFWMLLYKDPETENKYKNVNYNNYFVNLMKEINGLNVILQYPDEIVGIMSMLQAAYLETQETPFTFQNYRKDPLLFENKWKEKLSKLNQWIKEGKNSTNYVNLKEGIRQILIGYDEIEEIIMTCIKIEDNDGRNKVSYIKSDIEQTCYRFECLKQGKKVEKFKSAFDGNVTKYYFYQPTLLEEDDNDVNININNINVPESPKKEKKIKSIGRAIKNGFLNLGKRNSSNTKSKEKRKDKELGDLGALHMDE